MMKPTIAHNVSADPQAVERIIGHRWADRYIRNRSVETYITVLVFHEKDVVLSNQLRKALEKYSVAGQPILIAGDSFTVESVELARASNCDLVARSEAFWTDDRWLNRNS